MPYRESLYDYKCINLSPYKQRSHMIKFYFDYAYWGLAIPRTIQNGLIMYDKYKMNFVADRFYNHYSDWVNKDIEQQSKAVVNTERIQNDLNINYMQS